MESTHRCKHNMHISRWRGWREFHWTPKRLIMAQCYLHPRSCRRECAKNWPRFHFSFSHKVIFESGPRAANTLSEYIGHTRTRLKRPEYGPHGLLRHYLRNYAHLYIRCTVCIADGAPAAWELHVPVRDSRDLVERCTARASIKTRDISISFRRNCKFLHGMAFKVVSRSLSLSIPFSLSRWAICAGYCVWRPSIIYVCYQYSTKCFKAIGFRLQLLFNCSRYFVMKN